MQVLAISEGLVSYLVRCHVQCIPHPIPTPLHISAFPMILALVIDTYISKSKSNSIFLLILERMSYSVVCMLYCVSYDKWSTPGRFPTSPSRESFTKNEEADYIFDSSIILRKSSESPPLSTSLHRSPHAAVAAKLSRPSTDQPVHRRTKKKTKNINLLLKTKSAIVKNLQITYTPSARLCRPLRPGLGTTTRHAREFLSKHYSSCLEDKSISTRTGPPCSSLSTPIL